LEADQDCSDVLQCITAARGAMNGSMAGALSWIQPPSNSPREQVLATHELIEIARWLLK